MTAYLGRAGPPLFAHVEMFPSKTQGLWGRAIRPCQFARRPEHLRALSKAAPARKLRQPIPRRQTYYGRPQSPKVSLRPLAFGIAVCVGSYYGAVILTQRSDAKFLEVAKKKSGKVISDEALREWVELKETQQALVWMNTNHVPEVVRDSYSSFKAWWMPKSDGSRATWILIAINTIPFLVWRRPGAQNFMRRNFTHSPTSGKSFTMLTSAFSHHVSLIE